MVRGRWHSCIAPSPAPGFPFLRCRVGWEGFSPDRLYWTLPSLFASGVLLEVKERVRKEEEKGVTAAAAMFLDVILQLEEEGWLRGFMDALVAAGRFPVASVISSASTMGTGRES